MRGQELTLYERERIEVLLRGRWGVRRIARELHRDHSVISRELSRNRDRDGTYRSGSAQGKAARRRAGPHRRKLDSDDVLRNWTVARLQEGWSPGQAAGKLKSRPDAAWMVGKTLCPETIYRYIYEGEGRLLGLYQHLARKHKARRRRFGRKPRDKAGMPFLTPIAFRPAGRAPESDTMVFRGQRECLSNQYLPRFQLIRMRKVPDKEAEATLAAIEASVESLPYRDLWDNLTFDRGTEGARHYELRTRFGIGTFFCDPYCSWQKGGVENANGLVRRYLPFGADLSGLTDRDVYEIQEKINSLPRKGLGWRTPNEAAAEYVAAHGAPDLLDRGSGAFKT